MREEVENVDPKRMRRAKEESSDAANRGEGRSDEATRGRKERMNEEPTRAVPAKRMK